MRNQSRLIRTFLFHRFSVQIYQSYDILTSPLRRYNFLLNPANEALVGTKFSYFPRGGPVPIISLQSSDIRINKSSKWGGMEVGSDMLYPVQALDGVVHELCGFELYKYLQSLPEKPPYVDCAGQRIRCPVGTSVVSPSFGGLTDGFDAIIHTVPPFYGDVDWESRLECCYLNSFQLAVNTPKTAMRTKCSPQFVTMACVLLGSGCRGIPVCEASQIAAYACSKHILNVEASIQTSALHLHFVVRDDEDCEWIVKQFANALSKFVSV